MKKCLHIAGVILLYCSCSTSKNSIAYTSEDKVLLSAIKNFDKNPADTTLKSTLRGLYTDAAKVHLDNIDVYNSLIDAGKWDKIIKEYLALQHLSQVIQTSDAALSLLKVPAYNAELAVAKENAATDYYNTGLEYLNNNDKESARNAYYSFKKANEYIPGFKDVKRQLDKSYQAGVLNVIVNPVNDNSLYYTSLGRNRFGNSFNNDYLQRSLVRDLGGSYSKNAPARFYTGRDAKVANVNPDLVIDLTWLNLDVPRPYTSTYTKNVSRQIETGRDTSGHVYYETASATLSITKKYFTATGDLESRITDAFTENVVDTKRYSAQFNWQQEYATYTGDSRAITGSDLAMLSNNKYTIPGKEDILNELYQRIYPQVKSGIYNAVRW